MRIADLYRQESQKPVISFEFSRAKTEKAAQSLENALDVLTPIPHHYVSVTFGAGGTTRQGSFELIEKLKKERNQTVVAYIAAIGLGPEDIVAVLDQFAGIGIETVFVIRGDEPEGDEKYKPHPKALPHASDLLSFIKSRYNFCLGAAGYPEGHLESVNPEKDIEYVKLKQDSGAEYIVAQYVYDNAYFYNFVDRCRAAGVTVPIIPGIMPIYSAKMTEILAKVCGSTITDEVRRGIESVPAGEKGGVARFGVDFAVRQCRDLLKHGVSGLHFYTMNQGDSVAAVLNTLKKEGHFAK